MIEKMMARAQRTRRKLEEAGRLAACRDWQVQSYAPLRGTLPDVHFVRSRQAAPHVSLHSLKTKLRAAELAQCPFRSAAFWQEPAGSS